MSDHHNETFISKYIFSLDHKMIAKQFLITGMFMGTVGMLMSILFRLQLSNPGESFVLEWFLGEKWASGSFRSKYVFSIGNNAWNYINILGINSGVLQEHLQIF